MSKKREKVYAIRQGRREEKRMPFFLQMMIGFYFLIAFFEPYLNGAVGSVTKYYMFLLMVAVLFGMRDVRIRFYHYTFAIWFVYKTITIFWALDTRMFQLHIISQIGMTALLICLTMIYIDVKTIDVIVKSMWLGSAAIGVLSLFFSRPYHGEVETRMVLYLFGSEADPNNQAAFLVVGLAISLYYLLCLKSYKVISMVVILVNMYSMMMTGSRGGLVTLVALVVVFVLLNYNNEKVSSIFKKLFIMVILISVGYYLLRMFLPGDIFERLFTFEEYSGGSERTDIWKNAFELISKDVNFVFGSGWGSYFGFNGVNDAMHNTFLSIFSDTGIIGTLLFFIPIIIVVIDLLRRKEVLPVSVLVAGMVPSFFIEAINKRFFWNAIIFSLIVYNYRNYYPKNKNKYEW